MPSFRYRIELKVEDETGLATFILFDFTAEKLLHISSKELINKCLRENLKSTNGT